MIRKPPLTEEDSGQPAKLRKPVRFDLLFAALQVSLALMLFAYLTSGAEETARRSVAAPRTDEATEATSMDGRSAVASTGDSTTSRELESRTVATASAPTVEAADEAQSCANGEARPAGGSGEGSGECPGSARGDPQTTGPEDSPALAGVDAPNDRDAPLSIGLVELSELGGTKIVEPVKRWLQGILESGVHVETEWLSTRFSALVQMIPVEQLSESAADLASVAWTAGSRAVGSAGGYLGAETRSLRRSMHREQPVVAKPPELPATVDGTSMAVVAHGPASAAGELAAREDAEAPTTSPDAELPGIRAAADGPATGATAKGRAGSPATGVPGARAAEEVPPMVEPQASAGQTAERRALATPMTPGSGDRTPLVHGQVERFF